MYSELWNGEQDLSLSSGNFLIAMAAQEASLDDLRDAERESTDHTKQGE